MIAVLADAPQFGDVERGADFDEKLALASRLFAENGLADMFGISVRHQHEIPLADGEVLYETTDVASRRQFIDVVPASKVRPEEASIFYVDNGQPVPVLWCGQNC